MTLEEWCGIDELGYKLILTDSVANVGRMKRRVNKAKNITNLRGLSIADFAKEVVIEHEAELGNITRIKVIDDEMGALILWGILKDDLKNEARLYKFVPAESLCLETAKEIYRVIKVIRMGKKKEKELTDIEKQIDRLINAYEEILDGKTSDVEAVYDEIKIIKTATEILNEKSTPKTEYEHIAIFSYMEDYLTFAEKQFLDALGTDVGKIDVSAKAPGITKKFYKSYGQSNEIQQVINDISKEELLYGDVNIMYSSPEYENIIRYSLYERKIPFTFVTDYSLRDNAYISLLLAIFRWAGNNFNYVDFKEVANSMLIRKGGDYNRVANVNVGWGIDRYLEFVDKMRNDRGNYEKLLEDHKRIKARVVKDENGNDKKELFICSDEYVDFIFVLAKTFADLLTEKPNVGELYKAVIKAVREQVEKLNAEKTKLLNMEKPYIRMAEHLSGFFDYAGEMSGVNEAINFICENLSAISGKDEEKPNEVTVMKLGKTTVLERPYQYLLGMAHETFEPKVVDSPGIPDEEMFELLDSSAGYVELKTDGGKVRKSRLYETLGTMEKGTLSIITCYFDSKNIREISASSAYIELLEEAGNPKEEIIKYPNCKDFNCDYTIDVEKLYEEKLVEPPKKKTSKDDENKTPSADETRAQEAKEAAEEAKKRIEAENREKSIINWLTNHYIKEEIVNAHRLIHLERLSPSSLHALMECPLKFDYNRWRFAEKPKDEVVSVWLTPDVRGLLFHEVFEKYCNEKLVGVKLSAGDKPDVYRLKDIYDEAADQYAILVPAGSKQAYLIERESYYEDIKNYIDELYADLINNNLSVYACEKEYETDTLYLDTSLTLKTLDEIGTKKNAAGEDVPDIDQDTIAISFHGIIDRVDVVNDSDGDNPIYRIADYKTGRKDSLEKKIKNNTQIQHAIYPMGLDGVVYEFSYDFPCDGNLKITEPVKGKEDNYGITPAYLVQLVNVFIGLNGASLAADLEDDDCVYCDYKDICARRMNLI